MQVISVEPPNFVELEVTDTPPGVKGNTASGQFVPAGLQSMHTEHPVISRAVVTSCSTALQPRSCQGST
jgi:hypothetical protein